MPTTKAFGLFQPVYSGAARFLGLNLQAPPRPSTLRRGPPLRGLAAVVFGRFGRIKVVLLAFLHIHCLPARIRHDVALE